MAIKIQRRATPRWHPAQFFCFDDIDGDTCFIAPWLARLLGRGNGEVKCKTCNNCFHSSCVDEWFHTSGDRHCAVCRQPWDGVGAVGGEVEMGRRDEVSAESGRSSLSLSRTMTRDPRLGGGWVSSPTPVNISQALSSDIEEFVRRQNISSALSSDIEEEFLRHLNVNVESDSVAFDSHWGTTQHLQLDRVDSPTFVDLNNARDDHVQARPMSSYVRDRRQQSPLRCGSSLQPSHLRSWQPVDTESCGDDRDLELLRPTPRTGSAFSDALEEAVSRFNQPPRHPRPRAWDERETIGIGYRQAIPPRRNLSPWTLDDTCPQQLSIDELRLNQYLRTASILGRITLDQDRRR